jgi:hypothetical protein
MKKLKVEEEDVEAEVVTVVKQKVKESLLKSLDQKKILS